MNTKTAPKIIEKPKLWKIVYEQNGDRSSTKIQSVIRNAWLAIAITVCVGNTEASSTIEITLEKVTQKCQTHCAAIPARLSWRLSGCASRMHREYAVKLQANPVKADVNAKA